MPCPWKSKKGGATYRGKKISKEAVNKLKQIYDSILASGAKAPLASALIKWSAMIIEKSGRWVLKPIKVQKQETAQATVQEQGVGVSLVRTIGGGSYEDFKKVLGDALKTQFGGKGKYLWIVATYKDKVTISVDTANGKTEYYEIPYSVKGGLFSFEAPVKVIQVTSYVKAEQQRWNTYRQRVQDFVHGKASAEQVVASGAQVTREAICLSKN